MSTEEPYQVDFSSLTVGGRNLGSFVANSSFLDSFPNTVQSILVLQDW